MAKNSNLTAAKKAKNDEFYTQLADIENEVQHYWDKLKGKKVLCNCDDPEWSNFWRYFEANFDAIGLQALVSTHYAPGERSYLLEVLRDERGNRLPARRMELKGDGDFRSPECVALLQECDVVVTNPPFSLFREYVALLVQHQKQFLIIGNKNAVTYKEIFPLIKENMLWIGYRNMNSDFWMKRPDGASFEKRVDIEGMKGVPVKHIMACWYTNMDHQKRHEPMTLFRRYHDDPSKYPKYDNYDAINVDKVPDIPEDYMEKIGVPVTFLDKYNPSQFELIGYSGGVARKMSEIAQPGTFEPGGPQFYLSTGLTEREREREVIYIIAVTIGLSSVEDHNSCAV